MDSDSLLDRAPLRNLNFHNRIPFIGREIYFKLCSFDISSILSANGMIFLFGGRVLNSKICLVFSRHLGFEK